MDQGKLIIYIDGSILGEEEEKADELVRDKMRKCRWGFGYCSTIKIPEELNEGEYEIIEFKVINK